MALAAADSAERFAWPRVAEQVTEAYHDAIATPAPEGRVERAAVRLGVRAADLKPRAPARRLESLEPAPERSRLPALARRAAFIAVMFVAAALGVYALQKIGLQHIASALISSSPSFVVLALAFMCGAMVLRAISWDAILRAALPRARVRLFDAMQGTFIGVLMSSTLPARLGEPSRAVVVARRTGRPRENLPVVLGTIVSQTILNVVALMILGGIMFSAVSVFAGHHNALLAVAIAPAALLVAVLVAPALLRGRAISNRVKLEPVRAFVTQLRGALQRVRAGLVVFKHPRLGAVATVGQLGAWAMQCVSCYLLLVALGLDHKTGIAAAAGVLFAVNVTAVIPATPANLGVFQAACAAVLHAGWHVSYGDGVAYGVILQAVEVATAVLMGGPALLKEGMSWREIKLRAMHTTPVKLSPVRRTGAGRRAGEALSSES
jgi:phosphatidylinositol alpha-mannosyltransferase